MAPFGEPHLAGLAVQFAICPLSLEAQLGAERMGMAHGAKRSTLGA
jgi:hypothetical protein